MGMEIGTRIDIDGDGDGDGDEHGHGDGDTVAVAMAMAIPMSLELVVAMAMTVTMTRMLRMEAWLQSLDTPSMIVLHGHQDIFQGWYTKFWGVGLEAGLVALR